MHFFLRIFLHSIFILLLTVFQISFIQVLPGWFHELQLFLVVLIFVLSLYGWKFALFWGGVIGGVMDIYSFSFFGLHLLSLTAATLFIYLLSYNFFTNRSLYSFLALTVFATLFYEFFLRIIYYIEQTFYGDAPLFLLQEYFWSMLGKEILVNMAAMLLLFYIFNYVSNRFRPVFIER